MQIASNTRIDAFFSYTLTINNQDYECTKDQADFLVNTVGKDKISTIFESIALKKLPYHHRFFMQLKNDKLTLCAPRGYIAVLENAMEKLVKNRALLERHLPDVKGSPSRIIVILNEMIFGKTIPFPHEYSNSIMENIPEFHNSPFLLINTLEELQCKKDELHTPTTEHPKELIFSLLIESTPEEKWDTLDNYRRNLERVSSENVSAFKNVSKVIHKGHLLSEYEKRTYFREYDDEILKFGMFYKFGKAEPVDFWINNKISTSTCRDVKCGLFGEKSAETWVISSNTLNLDGITISGEDAGKSITKIMTEFPVLKCIVQADPQYGGVYIPGYSFAENKTVLQFESSFRSVFDIVFNYGTVKTKYSIKLLSRLID